MDYVRLGTLRAIARVTDLRNRAIPPEALTYAARRAAGCACGNALTIADRGSLCRQCRIARR